MADAYKVLGQGQMANAIATLFTVSTGSWIVKSVEIVNTNTTTENFRMCINGTLDANAWLGTSSNLIALKAGESYRSDAGWTMALENGATIAAVTTTASKVTVTISGDQVT
jgi:hypothetical protein